MERCDTHLRKTSAILWTHGGNEKLESLIFELALWLLSQSLILMRTTVLVQIYQTFYVLIRAETSYFFA